MRYIVPLAVLITLFQPLALARIVVAPVAQAGMVQLPYTVNDNAGNQWMVYQAGWLQQQGMQPVYSQGAMLSVNGQRIREGGNNQARYDEKSEELIFENLQVGNVQITRRYWFNKEEGYVRVVDVFKHNQNRPQTVNVSLQTSLNFGVQMTQTVSDTKKKEINIAWVAQTHSGRSAVEVYAGKGTKLAPRINHQQGNNTVNVSYSLAIPPGKQAAIVHLHGTAMAMDAGVTLAGKLAEPRTLAGLPADIRKTMANFPTAVSVLGDMEVLRGDMNDVIELRSGDQYRGAIEEASYKLQTFYGTVELPRERIVGLINVGAYRPRQLLVTVDGELFGGYLQVSAIKLQLSSGQVLQIPLGQINRLGYRKRAGEPEEWTFDKPLVMMRSGDRIAVLPPEGALNVNTRYGRLSLPPAAVASITFQSEEHGVHEVLLTDGSRFAGLVEVETFELKLADLPGQGVKFPTSTMLRLQMTPKAAERESTSPLFTLVNNDMLVGSLRGQLKLDTAFDTITVNGPEVRKVARVENSASDVQVTLWDGSMMSGQFQQPELECALLSGAVVRLPVALLRDYDQPLPQPSADAVRKIQALVADLNHEDWKQRDKAEQQLLALGSVVMPLLKEMRAAQPPEAQQRIDSILKQLEKQLTRPTGDKNVAAPEIPFNGEVLNVFECG